MTQNSWQVEPTKKLEKFIKEHPVKMRALAYALLTDMEEDGPYQPQWPNYGPLTQNKKTIPKHSFHCHLKKGKPTYVACWRVVDKREKIIEVYYVGTHERAPY